MNQKCVFFFFRPFVEVFRPFVGVFRPFKNHDFVEKYNRKWLWIYFGVNSTSKQLTPLQYHTRAELETWIDNSWSKHKLDPHPWPIGEIQARVGEQRAYACQGSTWHMASSQHRPKQSNQYVWGDLAVESHYPPQNQGNVVVHTGSFYYSLCCWYVKKKSPQTHQTSHKSHNM